VTISPTAKCVSKLHINTSQTDHLKRTARYQDDEQYLQNKTVNQKTGGKEVDERKMLKDPK